MKKVILWIIGIVIAILFLLLVLLLAIGFWVTKEAKDYTGYSNDDLIKYVEKKYDIPIEVVSNKGRIPSSFGGLEFSEAHVRTVDKEPIDFVIHINLAGHISKDNYKKQKNRFDLNRNRDHSTILNELKAHGFRNISFGDSEEDPAFHMDLPENLSIQDPDAFQLIYKALPELKLLQKEVLKTKYDMRSISIGGVLLNLNETYKNAENVRNKLVKNNVDIFASYLFESDFALIEPLLTLIEEQGFKTDRNMKYALKCYEMTRYDKCDAYSFILYPIEQSDNRNENKFRYDSLEDRERLFIAIREIQKVQLPIEKVMVDSLYVPELSKNQHKTEEELLMQDGMSRFVSRKVEIQTTKKFQAVDDLNFVY